MKSTPPPFPKAPLPDEAILYIRRIVIDSMETGIKGRLDMVLDGKGYSVTFDGTNESEAYAALLDAAKGMGLK